MSIPMSTSTSMFKYRLSAKSIPGSSQTYKHG
eukprot:CAMPEP_0203664582 /NCGR_PEP_ID=MMETSP0090-20130426/1980_1 /ASSEMBLY_ACC=CAM_ASM_001088 /TAXON_ID=426623 /ORGANISM="Chaetoceros affinis, Strain CCMP159" /LENGTH=31 /DNA_ID= /DNA_START= /DNA_END= /DNA_ORIENTATION=